MIALQKCAGTSDFKTQACSATMKATMVSCGRFLRMYSTQHSKETIVRINTHNSFSCCCEVSKFVEEMGKRNGNWSFKWLFSDCTHGLLCAAFSSLLGCNKLRERNLRLSMQRLEVEVRTNSNRRPFLWSKRNEEQSLFECNFFYDEQFDCVMFVSIIFNLIITHTLNRAL